MAWFRCSIRGENFPLAIDGGVRPTGFYTTRYVEAADAQQAEAVALDRLRNEEVLKIAPGTLGMERAQVFFEEIEEVAESSGPNAGFTFFNEDEHDG